MQKRATWNHERKRVKPSLYFPRDTLYQWKAMVYNGPCQPHTRLFGPSTHWYHPKQSLVSRLRTDSINNSRLGLISVDLMLSHSTPRVACVAYPLSQLRPHTKGTVKGTVPPLTSFIPPHPTPASAVSSQHHPTPRVPRPTRGMGRRKQKSAKREDIFSFSNVNSLLALKFFFVFPNCSVKPI